MADSDHETDPYTEPENSTVENWHGQRVGRDTELAERLVEEAGGDEAAAEARFAEEAEGPADRRGGEVD